jgi:hypothetical protein
MFRLLQFHSKNLQSTPFRPIAPFDETEMHPRARHVSFLGQIDRNALIKTLRFHESTSQQILEKNWGSDGPGFLNQLVNPI